MTPELETRYLPEGVRQLILPSPILSTSLLSRLGESLELLRTDPRPMVLSSSHPKIFLAGAHLAEIASLDAESSRSYAALGREVLERIRRYPAPVIAAVHGTCAGGGLDLVLSCDAVFAAPGASFAHPGVHRGLVTGWGGTAMFPAVSGSGPARRLFLEGRFISAGQAKAEGWVAGLDGDPLGAARREARRLAALAPGRLTLWRRLSSARFVDSFRVSVVHNWWRLIRMETGARA